MKTNIFLALLCTTLLSINAAKPAKTFLFAGTYTNNQPDKGIYVYKFDSSTGNLTLLSTAQNIINPSYLTNSSDGQFLYVCNDTRLPKPGSITAFRIDSSNGTLSLINKVESGGENPVYVSTTRDNKWLITGNYSSGTATAIGINTNGALNPAAQIITFKDSSINKARQTMSHIHASYFLPDYKWVLFPDLGADKIRIYKFDAQSEHPIIQTSDKTVKTTPGSGPRHFAFHPNRRFGYLAEELSGSISAYRIKNGQLNMIQKVFSYSKKYEGYGTADIHITPNGSFLYASNRLNDENTLSIFRINSKTGKLSLIGHQKTLGDHPRNFTIDPTGKFLLVANMNSNNIIVFRINQKTGLLRQTGNETSIPNPSCLKMFQY